MASMEREPFLKSGQPKGEERNDDWCQGKGEQWADCAQNVLQSAGDGLIKVDPSERRQAAHEHPYPQWIYGALVAPKDERRMDSGEGLSIQSTAKAPLSQGVISCVHGLREDEIRDLIVDHVDHQCCWGRRPASKWEMKKVENCNAFMGALETFIEEREVHSEVEPYSGQPFTAKESERVLGPWEVDMKDEFPLLFTEAKEARTNFPFSQKVEICKTCSGRKEVLCLECHPSDKPGESGPRRRAACSVCSGRGLIAHQDGSDSECGRCKGTGMKDCKQCNSRGSVKCDTCSGSGFLLHSQFLIVRWRTLINKKVSASSCAATLPDDVLHSASGIQLYCDQSHSCQPVEFPSSSGVTKLSADLFATREAVPPTARLIVERQLLTLIPLTRVIMCEGDSSFLFYIIGLSKKIYMKNYPATCGLCCCVQMCTLQ